MTTLPEWHQNRILAAEIALLDASAAGRLSEVRTLLAGGACVDCSDEFQ
jgi:hypothetical protein